MTWLWILIAIFVIALGVGALVETYTRSDFESGFWGTLIAILILWVATAGIWRINAITKFPGGETVSYTASDVLKAQGIDPAKSQPLTLGKAIEGSQGEVHGSGDLFGFYIEGSSHPASALRLGVKSDGYEQIVDIPYSKVKFVKKPNVTSSASIIMDKEVVTTATSEVKCSGNFWEYESGCWYTGPAKIQESDVWSDLQIKGPGPVLQEHLYSITLTVTPEQYQAYLKGNGVTK